MGRVLEISPQNDGTRTRQQNSWDATSAFCVFVPHLSNACISQGTLIAALQLPRPGGY